MTMGGDDNANAMKVEAVKPVVRERCRELVTLVWEKGVNITDATDFDAQCCVLLQEPCDVMAQCVQDKLSSDQHEAFEQIIAHCVMAAACFLSDEIAGCELMAAHSKAETLLSDCMVVAGCHTQAQVITKHLDILLHLCVDGISKEDWTAQGSLPMRVLRWLVTQVTLPNLGGDKLGRLLKAVFPLVEDLNDSTQLVGMHMLRHIVFNVTATELRWYGVVLMELLRIGLTSRKPATLDAVLECLVQSLAMLAVGSDLQPYDDCFLRVLNDASLCSDVHLRRIYLVRLRPAIERMGAPHSLHLVRYLQPLLKVLLASFESVNADLLIDALQTLETTVRGAWPRIPAHSEEIVVGVFRVVAFCEMFDGTPPHAPSVDIKQTLLDTCAKVLQLVRDLDQARTDEMINKISAECRPLDRFCAQIVTQEKR